MVWAIEFDKRAIKDLKKLNVNDRKDIIDYLKNIITSNKTPTLFGKPLTNDKVGLWRYRVGKYRVICQLKKETLILLVVRVGKRDEIYKN
ncbi:MAG: type II toxin-antitoxin system RelE/ParE family toxin [Alphaproteobacteria bacterium]|nr:type II toxin-antitoxin system RelE/ParE family toxin [Alphaproteobacteria bacterium]OJV15981.1 MAG: addiction module toxin RelE [Alphaproteobacteria bacterium 33-17]